MTITNLDDGTGATHATYHTLDEARAYLQRVNYAFSNDTATPDVMLTQLLWKSAALVDSYPYTGTKHDESQELAFGRDNLLENGSPVSTTSDYTPPQIFEADLLTLNELRLNPNFGSVRAHNLSNSNIKSVRGGNSQVVFQDNVKNAGRTEHRIQNALINSLLLPFTVEASATSSTSALGGSLTFGVDQNCDYFGRDPLGRY